VKNKGEDPLTPVEEDGRRKEKERERESEGRIELA
jgi:hypothetical protein